MAEDRWLYTTDGKPAYYQREGYVYSAQTHQCEFFVEDGWFHRMGGGEAAYYTEDNWVYDLKGKPAYYYDDG